MNKILVGALLVLALSQICLSGHIYTWDVDLFYQNEKNAQRVTLFFSLESGLARNQIIRVKFPDTATSVASGSLSAVGQTASSGSLDISSTTSGDVYAVANVEIPSNTWYQLVLNFGNTYVSNQTPGYKGVIYIETASGTDANRIIYDSNSVAGVYQLAPRPTETLGFTVTYPSTVTNAQKTALVSTYDIFFDLKPQVPIKGGTKIRVELDTVYWKLGSSCNGADQTCAEGAAACENITLVAGSCTVGTGNKFLELVATSDIVKDQTVRIKTTVTNPSAKRTSAGVTAYSISKIANLIFEKKALTGTFSVDGINPTKPTVKYLWGVSTFTSTKTLCPLGFYKRAADVRTSNAGASKIQTFNDLTLEFSVATTTPAGQNLEVSIATPSADFTLVLGSIRTDLPVFSGKTQTITFSSNTIAIRNVAPLSSSSTYKVLAKVAFASTASGSSAFAVTLKTLQDSEADITLGTSTAADIAIVQNYEYFDLAENGYHATAPTVANPAGYNYVFSNTGDLLTGSGTANSDEANALTYMKTLFYHGSALTLVGYPGVGLSTLASPLPVKELIFIINPSLSQLCCKTATNCENSAVTTCDTGSIGANNWVPAIGLFMVANSNILNLDNTASARNGVITYGGFWGGCGYLNNNPSTLLIADTICLSNGKTASSTTGTGHLSVLKNQWDFSESGVAYLQAVCIPKAKGPTSDCLNIASTTSNAATVSAVSYSALGLKVKSLETNIFKSSQDKVSQLYGSQQVIDFVVCFGSYTIAPNAARPDSELALSSFVRASQALLNVYIMNYGDQVNNLRVSLFNYLRHASSVNYHRAPIFLRVSGYIGSSTYSALTIFLDNRLGISNAKQCTSSASSATCNPYASDASETGNPVLRSRVDIISSIASGSSAPLEFFVPVAPFSADVASGSSLFIDVGLSSVEENYILVKEIYRIYGNLWGLHGTTGIRLINQFATNAWSPAYDASANTVDGGTTCADSSTGFLLTGANFQPGYTHESLNLPTSVTAGCLGVENGDVLKGGTGFTAAHYSGNHDFLGSGSAKWNDAVTCLKFRIDYSDSINSNGFVCGFVSNIATASINVVLRAFTVPWTWGASYNAPRTAYSWSGGAKGQLRAYKLQANMDTAQYQRSCTTSDWGTVYKSSSLQRLTFTFSPSAGIDLTWETFSLVANFNANLDGLSIGACSITPSAGSATCQGSDTTFSSKTIAVTRTSSAPRASLAKGTQTVVLTVSQSSLAWAGSVTSATYTATIWNSGTKVDSCETTKTITYSSSDDTPVLSLGTPILQTSKGSRTSFQFTFTVGATSRQVWASTKLDFVLGWLGDNLAGVAANLHCFIRTGNSVSFGFRTLDLTTPASPSLVVNTDLPVGSWTYVCNGARAPALSASTKLTFSWKTGSTSLASIAEDSANAVAALSLTDSQAVLEASLRSKLWATPGVEASYTFLFKPKRANYTLEGRVYVDFSIDIPPRGNEAGLPSCEINSTRVYCEWAQERRLVVWPVIPLTALTTQTQFSYELAIHGIAQPPTLGSFKSIGITLDLDSNPNNGVSEWAEITDSAPSTAAITPLLISEYSNSNSVTRSNTEIKINLNIPKDTIVKDARVYVELPAYFGDSLWLVSSVTCNLYRISDLTAANLVQNCTLLRNRRVKIFTNLDSGSNVDNIYVLSIGGVPTPAQPTLNAPNWVTVFLASSDETTVTHRTAPGYINATQVVYNHEANKQVPDWFVRTAQGVARVNGDLEVTIGTYRSDVILRSPTVADVSYNFALGGEFISNLAVFPSNLRVVFGEPESRFRIGAKANAVQGRYLVTTTKSNEQNANRQIPIPTLPILVRNNTCTVQANNENIKIPAGGWSLPIIFDFADCMPVTDVQIDANFTDADKYNISFGPEVSNTLASEKLVFESWNNTRISFLVRSFNASQKAGLKTKISFTMSGTNKDSYGVPRVVNVELVDSAPFNVAPTVTTLSATPVAGQVTLNLACSASGNIYFAIGTNPDIQSRSVGDIKNSTYAKKISLTPRDPTDAWWRVNGFVSQTGTTAVSIVIPGVKSAALYYAVAYCQNQMEIPSSNNLKTSWNQTDNGGRIAKATLVFNATLTQDQQKDIACALANLLKVPQNTVMTQDGVFCSTLRRLQSSNSSNSSNSTNSTPTVQQNVSYSWFVLPDYAGVSSSIHTNLQSQMVAGFTDKLFALTTGKANTFPMVRSFSFFAPSSAVAAIPSTNEINPTINIFETYVTFDITLSNSSGYVYWGIGSNSSSRPVGRILRDKTDANGVALVAADRKYVPAKTLVSFNATSSLVRNDTDYKLYISLSSDDPGAEAVFSDVVEKTFRTKKPSFSGRTVLGSLLVGLLLLLAVFV